MNPIMIFTAVAAQQPAPFVECDVSAETQDCGDVPYFGPPEIVVTASREPAEVEDSAASVTVFDTETLDAVALPLTADILRLAPGVSVASSGPKGTQTQIRIRGAEANHSLLFVDGIRLNDPAAGNEARLELLAGDALSRIELVRGPQSALWGSEALGGVVAVETANPLTDSAASAAGEYGSHDSVRASGQFAARAGNVGIAGSAGWLSSDGIDSFGAGGERDGYEHRSGSLKLVFSPLPAQELGLVGHWIEGESAFDGFDPVTFRRADTSDATDNSLFALRGWSRSEWDDWSLLIDGSILESENRNRLGDAPLNRTSGGRFTLGGQLSKRIGGHRLTGAIEYEGEDFRARDQIYFGLTDQDRSRDLTALVGEWRAEWSPGLVTGLAVRHDAFSAYAATTSVRASVLLRPFADWTVHGAYGEGIAQPTFYDLYGFFPGSFAGNPDLKPETSTGWEVGLTWNRGRASIGITGFTHRLRDEIVNVFDPATFLSSTANVDGVSGRRGVELDAHYRFSNLADFSFNYTLLDADERQVAAGAAVREVRRPRHSANAILTGSADAFSWGATLAYVGERQDTDFDLFPARRVRLGDYLLASLKLGYRIMPALEAYARVENAFDANYQDVVGYHTPGRTVHAGFRLHLGR